MPNQLPKIISTGNTFLTGKKKYGLQIPSIGAFLDFFLLAVCVLMCEFLLCFGPILETVVKTLQNGTGGHLRGLFF